MGSEGPLCARARTGLTPRALRGMYGLALALKTLEHETTDAIFVAWLRNCDLPTIRLLYLPSMALDRRICT